MRRIELYVYMYTFYRIFIITKMSESNSKVFNKPVFISNILNYASSNAEELRRVERVSKAFQETSQHYASGAHTNTITQSVLDEAAGRLDETIISNALEVKSDLDYTRVILAYAHADQWDNAFHIIDKLELDLNKITNGVDNLLFIATDQKKSEIIQKLVFGGIMIDTSVEYIGTALTIACQNNSVPIIETLIRCGIDPYAGDERALDPFSICARKGYLEAITILLGEMGTYDARKRPSMASIHHPFYIACAHNQMQIVRFFLLSGLDISSTYDNMTKQTAYSISYINGYEAPIDAMLSMRAGHERGLTSSQWHPIFARHPNTKLLRKLIAGGLRIPIGEAENDAIFDYIDGWRLKEVDPKEFIQLLIEAGANTTSFHEEETLLTYAIKRGQNFLINPLIEIDRNLSILKNGNDNSPIRLAILSDNVEAIEILLEHMVKNGDDIVSAERLIHWCGFSNAKQYIPLIQKAFDYVRNDRIALMYIHKCDHEGLEELLKNGLDPNTITAPIGCKNFQTKYCSSSS
jgi:ankyrin repeat protein